MALLMNATQSVQAEAPVCQPETVVLLHGLIRSPRSMQPMATALEDAGFAVRNIGYPSTDHVVETLTERTFAPLQALLDNPACRLHFVTHSMGGILLRQYLAQREAPGLGRVVMLSPPNQGSEVVDRLRENWFFKWMNGPAGQQLGTGADSLPLALPNARNYELGVITGDFSINLILSQLIPGPDDGKVSVERAKLEGMRDFLVVPYSHPVIMRRKPVIAQTLHFLKHGRFSKQTQD